MKIIIFFIIICFCYAVNAQDNYFRIQSFTVDGKEVADYSVTFEINNKLIIPVRQGNQIFVPKEVSESESTTIKFQASGYSFQFDDMGFRGYNDNEKSRVKTDYNIGVDNKPFEITVSSKNKKLFKKYKIIYFIEVIPRVFDSPIGGNPYKIIYGDKKKKFVRPKANF